MTVNFKKTVKILGIIIAIIIVAFVLFLIFVRIQINRGDLIKWDGQWYTKEQLKEKFPPQYIETPAKNTPEEVYAKFRQALLDNDIEMALGQMSDYRKNEYAEAFKDRERLIEWAKKLPREMIKKDQYENFSSYYYKNAIDEDDKIAHPINFSKDSNGYWKIDQI